MRLRSDRVASELLSLLCTFENSTKCSENCSILTLSRIAKRSFFRATGGSKKKLQRAKFHRVIEPLAKYFRLTLATVNCKTRSKG